MTKNPEISTLCYFKNFDFGQFQNQTFIFSFLFGFFQKYIFRFGSLYNDAKNDDVAL